MDVTSQLLVGLGITVILSIILGSSARRSGTSVTDYFWGNRELKEAHGVHLLLSSPFSMNGILYQTWLGYRIGYAAVILQVIWCLSYILMSRYSTKISRLSKEGTLHGVIGKVFGEKTERAAALASLIGFTLQIGWELIVGISIFAASASQSMSVQAILILTLAGIAAIYTMLGGLRGNLNANRVQNYIGGLSLWAIVIFLMVFGPGATGVAAGSPWDGGSFSRLITELTLAGFITNALFSLCWQFVDMSTWQNIAATQGANTTPRRVLLWSSFWIFIFPGVVGTLAGMYLRSIPNLTADNIMPHLVGVLSGHAWLCVFVAAGFGAAMLSTIDGLLLAAAQAATWDITQRSAIRRILEARLHSASSNPGKQEVPEEAAAADSVAGLERKLLDQTRVWILVLAALGGGLVWWFTVRFKVNIFDLVYIVVGAQMVLVPVIISVLIGDENKRRGCGLASIVLGLLTSIILVAWGVTKQNAQLLALSPALSMAVAFLFWLPSWFTGASE